MDKLTAYIPMDRRQAMAQGATLPDRTSGAALFADIFGFTPLAHAFAKALGPKRGAEELLIHLNAVYEALISSLHRYGGSVIGFVGDAITCWFDDQDLTGFGKPVRSALRAVASALAMLRTSAGRRVPLGVKVAIAAGPALPGGRPGPPTH